MFINIGESSANTFGNFKVLPHSVAMLPHIPLALDKSSVVMLAGQNV